jgi:hypothetical protein
MGAHIPPNVNIAKGPVCFALDQISVGPGSRARLQNLNEALKALAPSYMGLTNTFDEYLLSYVFSPPTRVEICKNLESCWFNPASPDAYFPGVPVSKIYGPGVIQTLTLSLAAKGTVKPIDSWWVVDKPQVMMVNLESQGMVVLLIETPRPKASRKAVPTKKWILGEREAYITRLEGKTVRTRRVKTM